MTARALCLLALLPLALSGVEGLGAATPPPRPIAIKGATIVVAPGQAIEKGVVVLRDGLIEAVGADVAVPPDAEVIDGAGLHVYAGFVDARTTLGLGDTKVAPDARKREEGEKPDVVQEAPPRMEQANRKGLRPDLRAAALLHVAEADLKKHHAGGFALALSAPAEEFLGGLGALHALSGAPPRNALLRAWTGPHGGFKSYGEGYPVTTMGAIAHLRQVLSDAVHYGKPALPGAPRPPLDAGLDALQPLLRREIALFFEAETEREILRAVALAREFNLKLVITGGAEAGGAADVLKAADIPVILTLQLPKDPPKVKDPDPEPAKLKLERERLRDARIRAAQTLHEAGVPFCFSTQGLEPKEALAALRKRVELGLKPDAALAGLTINPSQLFDVAGSQGTVEKGKAASLTLLSAPLGDAKAAVKHVIVDGVRFDVDGKAPEEKKKDDEKDKEKKEPPAADYEVEIEAERVPKSRGGDLFVRNATLLGAPVARGSILIRGGKIREIGELAAPEGVAIVEGAGLFVMPGVVDCHSHIACEGGLNEGSQTVTPEVRVADVLNPKDVDLWRNLAGGVTTANVLHGSANAIGGQNAVIKLKYGSRDLLFPGAPRGVKFALGENPKQSNFSGNKGKRFPNTRMGVEASIRRAFAEAEEYRKLKNPRPDLRLQTLCDILDGKLLVHCHCYRADEILMILEVAREHRLKLATLQHVLEGYRVMPEIATLGAGASTFSDWWAYKIEAHEAIPHNAAMMVRAKILTSINSDYPDLARHLPLEASKAMKYGGLSEAEALALVTINPAKQLGIGDRVGSIEVGKDGDLAIFNGHPFSAYSRCVATVVDGDLWYDARGATSQATPEFRPSERRRRPPGPLTDSETISIVNAMIHLVPGQPFQGNLVMSKGKIQSIDIPGLPVPTGPGTSIIDGTGLHVYPGLISALSSVGLTEIGSVAGTRDEAEIGGVQPDLKALTAVNPHSELIPVARSTGVTSVLAAPQGSLIHGQSALIRLDGRVPRDMAVKEVWALHVSYPALAGTDEKKDEDAKKLKAFREPFEDAKRYAGAPRDLGLEAMVPYMKAERPVVFHANDERRIRASLKFAEEFGLKAVLAGGAEAWKVAALLAEKKIPVILAGAMGTPAERHDPVDAAYANAARLHKAGVTFAIAAALEEWHGNTRNLPYNAAWASAYGLPREEALKAVTIYPARILGVDARLGSLEPGKDADLLVTTGDPLETLTDIVHMFIQGRPIAPETKHTRLYDRFR
ncbi:MAG TPA: amidohydrolase family protein [Planctomycetota bacterium]